MVAWSPCNKFIAFIWDEAATIDVLDAVTLQKLQALNFQQSPGGKYARPALVFSPDSRILTCLGPFDGERTLKSWDLQTGGQAGIIRWESSYVMGDNPSIVYTANGKMVGVRYQDGIHIFDIASCVHMHSYSISSSIVRANDIWTHGESFRFTTVDTKTITIWEVGFTSDARPTEVETIPTPEHVDFGSIQSQDVDVKFLPAPCRLAFTAGDRVMVWDVQNSKYLLHSSDVWSDIDMSFSSDGRLFACSTSTPGPAIYLWRSLPPAIHFTGYLRTTVDLTRHTSPSPQMESGLSHLVIARCGCGAPKILPPPLPVT